MKKRFWTSLLSGVMALSLLAGCGGGAKTDQPGAANNPGGSKTAAASLDITAPVTLKIYAPIEDNLYTKYFEEPVMKRYPNVTLERLKPAGGGGGPAGLRKLLSEGNPPDLIYSLPGWYGQQKLMDAFADLTPLINKYGFDMNRLDSTVVDTMKTYSPQGRIDFMPESMTTMILLYNKSIFDKFGVPYPKDGMNWDEVKDLIPRLSRTENGVNYRGFDVQRDFHINNVQLSYSFVNPTTKKTTINNENWAKYFSFYESMFRIPGNKPDKQVGNFNQFMNDKRVAMYLGRLEFIDRMVTANDPDLEWDLVTMPVFKDAPAASTQVNAPFLAISPTSENKDDAFKIIALMLSDEEQLRKNKEGRMTVLKDESIRKEYGKNIKELANKNIGAALKLKAAKPREFTLYDNFAVAQLSAMLDRMIMEGVDVNTALRETEELINKDIEANLLAE